ncbi:MAG: DUF5011 domain-containing protein, partial [Opitutae bacterium]|nr:DUF5011 domain-containing protein [Opitutae bacterium]
MCSIPIRWLSLLGFTCSIILSAILSMDAQVRKDDLVIWLDFNELNETSVLDLSGNGLDGVTAGGPALEDGQYGKVLSFNGDGQKVTIGYDKRLNISQYTAAIWLKSVKSNEAWVGVFGRPGRHYNFWAGDSQTDNFFVHHRYRDGTNTSNGAGDARSFPHGEWTHVVLTNDGDTSVTYVNGLPKSMGNVGTLTYTTSPLYIGANPDNGNGNWYEGLIDDFRLYGVALSVEEVFKAYNDGKGDFDKLPVVTPTGEAYVRVPMGGTYTELGATATDPEDGDLDTVQIAYRGPQFPPEELAADTHEGLQLWLKADVEASGDTWVDQSGKGNNASRNGSPTIVEDALNGLPVMRYSGTNGEYHNFPNMTDIRTVFWVVNLNKGKVSFLLGDDNTYHFHSDANRFWHGVNTHDNVRDGDLAINGGKTNGLALNVPDTMSVISLRTTGNVEASNFSNDRNIDNRYWSGDLAELLIYNTALTDEQIADVERRLGYKWGLQDDLPPVLTDAIDTATLADWIAIYTATDSFGNTASAERNIRIFDPAAPVITLIGESVVTHEQGSTYTDPGATVLDKDGNALDATKIQVTGTVQGGVAGTHVLTYDFTDAADRPAETLFRKVVVVDTVPPVLTLQGNAEVKHLLGTPYHDAGVHVVDTGDQFVEIRTHSIDAAVLYSFDDPENPAINIAADGDFNGVFLNGANWDPDGRFGGAMTLQSDGRARMETVATPIDLDGEWTVATYFKGLYPSSWRTLTRGGSADHQFIIQNNGTELGLFDNEGGKGFQGTGFNMSAADYTKWHHIAGVGKEGRTRFYVDGKYVGTVQTQSQSDLFSIGNYQNGGQRFSRLIDDFRVYHRALTDFEVFNLCNTGIPDTSPPGTYIITYRAVDSTGNEAETVSRTVTVLDAVDLPVISLAGQAVMEVAAGALFTDPGFTVSSAFGDELDASGVVVSGKVDTTTIGEQILAYTFTDANDIPAEVVLRTVRVVDFVPPVVTLTGDAEVTIPFGRKYDDPGATAEDNVDGSLPVAGTLGIPSEGLVLHMDAGSLALQDGEPVTVWPDLSGAGNHADLIEGEPTWSATGLNGRPSVRIDGKDLVATTKVFNNRYSIFTISRLSGLANERLISSRTNNWILGYWQGYEDVMHADGWVTIQQNPATTAPHLYSAMNDGDNLTSFYADTRSLGIFPNHNGQIGQLQLGGWQTGDERGWGEIAKILVYDRPVSGQERINIEAHLNASYGLNGLDATPLDITTPGEYTIQYSARDSSGNLGLATRKVIVAEDPEVPVINLLGDRSFQLEVGSDFTDPGVTIATRGGTDLDAAGVVVSNPVNNSLPGSYIIRYNFTDPEGRIATEVTRIVEVVDTVGPVITINGEPLVRIGVGEVYTDAGATAVDALSGNSTVVSQSSSPMVTYLPGLTAGGQSGNYSVAPNSGSYGIDPLGPTYSESTASPPWAGNWTIVYTGQIYDDDGKISFTENIDDKAWLTVNGQKLLDNAVWNQQTQATADFGEEGWFDFELRISNGGGGAGRVGAMGFGYDPAGGNNFILPRNTNGQMDLFRVASLDPNSLDTSVEGTFSFTYTSSDTLGNTSSIIRTIIVSDQPDKPLLTLKGDSVTRIPFDSVFEDPGVEITDTAGVVPANLNVEGAVDTAKLGEYVLTYSYISIAGLVADTVLRKVFVADEVAPVITLNPHAGGGVEVVNLFLGQAWEDPLATASDNADGVVNLDDFPSGLAAYYNFEDPVIPGKDLSGNGHHGGPRDGALQVEEGRYGMGLHVPWKPNASLDLAGNEVDIGEEWTIAAWFREMYPTGYWRSLTRGSIEDHQVMVHYSNHQLGSYLNGGGGFKSTGFTMRPETYTGWHHIATVGKDSETRYYIDGQLVGSSSGKSTSEITRIGSWGNDQHFAKYIDEVFIFHRALGDTEVNALQFVESPVNTSIEGTYRVPYFAGDASGNHSATLRTVVIEKDPQAGVITLVGDAVITHEAGNTYQDPGATLADAAGAALPPVLIQVAGIPDGKELGTFIVTYNYTSGGGTASTEVVRTVEVVDTTPPVITLVGNNPLIISSGTEFIDPGATALDAADGILDANRLGQVPKEGLVLHLDASRIEGLNDGDMVFNWPDVSSAGNHADQVKDNPTWHPDGLNGKPVVRFDGDDLVWTTKDFGYAKEYTILTVARYTGGDNERVISSRGTNWLFGFHGNTIRRFYANGWIYNVGGSDTNWHLHGGTIRKDARADFWLDLNQLASNKTGASTTAYSPGVMQLGGYNDSNELSKCEVAEVLFYERSLTQMEIESVQGGLNSKYGLGFGTGPVIQDVDVNTPGIYTVIYSSSDAAGNSSRLTRKVVVKDGATLPVISLLGDEVMTIEAGAGFTDAGAMLADAAGNQMDASKIQVTGQVKPNQPGEYVLAYDFLSDDRERAVTVTRKVTVVDTSAPVLTLVGGDTLRIPVGGEFADPGVTAVDIVDGEVFTSSSLVRQNSILHRGFVQNWSDLHLFLDQNAGLLQGTPTGETYLAGPLYFNGDAAFVNAGAGINRNDQYQNLFLSTFHAKVDGVYEFAVTERDDWCVLWLDLDRDGVFEKTGDMGNEWINNGVVQGGRIVYLQKGLYRLAVGHMERTGNSRVSASVRTPEGAGPATLSTIDPTDPLQEGLWLDITELDAGAPGTHLIEYTAVDSNGNESKATRTVIFESVKDAPLLFLVGDRTMTVAAGSDFTDPGATVEDKEGNPLEAKDITVSGSVDTARPGTYTLKYNFIGPDGVSAKTISRKVKVTDLVPPVLTLNGEADMSIHQGSTWVDPGATASDNIDGELGFMSSESIPIRGLVMHLDANRIPFIAAGDSITDWPDISGAGNHLDNVIGSAQLIASDTGGRPAVYFDGKAFMATTKSFTNRYTVASVARYDGTLNARLISSRTQNWIHGFHNQHVNCFHASGWATNTLEWESADTQPHLNISRSDSLKIGFWGDGLDKTLIPDRAGLHMGQFQLGGWESGREPAAGYISEVLIYDRPLDDADIASLQFYLSSKYGLGGEAPVDGPVNSLALGDYEVLYSVVDSSGNRVMASRVVHVIPDPTAPALTLLGETVFTHEGGNPYVDPGVSLVDGAGQPLDASLIDVTNPMDIHLPGEYIILYRFTDAQGREAPVISRKVIVEDTTPPVITMSGDSILKLEIGTGFTDPGATALDAVSGELTIFSTLDFPSDGILGYWSFNETEGDVANDNINGNHGTLTNFDGSQWVTGRNGNALSFDGANDSVTLPVAAHPTSGDTQVTIAFWCKGGGLLPRNTSILESKKGGNRIFNIHHPWSNGNIYWDVGNGSYDRIDKAASAAEYKDNWVHWAFMKNRTSGSQQIYKDGELWHSGTNMKRA